MLAHDDAVSAALGRTLGELVALAWHSWSSLVHSKTVVEVFRLEAVRQGIAVCWESAEVNISLPTFGVGHRQLTQLLICWGFEDLLNNLSLLNTLIPP